MLQDIIVYIIGIITAICVVVWLYRIVVKRHNPCNGCCGCDVRDRLDKKCRDCSSMSRNGC